MTPENFIMWISGALEYVNLDQMDHTDLRNLLKGIKDHLALTVTKVTPERLNIKPPAILQIPTLPRQLTKEEKDIDDMIERYRKDADRNKPLDPFKLPDFFGPQIPPYRPSQPDYWLRDPRFGEIRDTTGGTVIC